MKLKNTSESCFLGSFYFFFLSSCFWFKIQSLTCAMSHITYLCLNHHPSSIGHPSLWPHPPCYDHNHEPHIHDGQCNHEHHSNASPNTSTNAHPNVETTTTQTQPWTKHKYQCKHEYPHQVHVHEMIQHMHLWYNMGCIVGDFGINHTYTDTITIRPGSNHGVYCNTTVYGHSGILQHLALILQISPMVKVDIVCRIMYAMLYIKA